MKKWTEKQRVEFNRAYNNPEAKKCRAITLKGERFLELEHQYYDIKLMVPIPRANKVIADYASPPTCLKKKDSFEHFGRLVAEKIATGQHQWFIDLVEYMEGKRNPRKTYRLKFLQAYHDFSKEHDKRKPTREELKAAVSAKIQITQRSFNRTLKDFGLHKLPRERSIPTRGRDRTPRITAPRSRP